MSRNKKIIITAILLAMQIVLSRFLSIRTPIIKISFAFIPTMICAVWLGPKWTMFLCAVEDLIGATFFPMGPYFVGYTISAAVQGLIYGLLLFKENEDSFSDKQFIIRLIIATCLDAIVVNIGMNTLWTSITSGKAFVALLGIRTIKQLIMIPIQVAIIFFLEKTLRKPFYTYIRSNDD